MLTASHSYAFVLWLVGEYADNHSPFADWRPPNAAIPRERESVVHAHALGLQLATWFMLQSAWHGSFAAECSRDSFILNLQAINPSLSETTEQILDFTESSIRQFEQVDQRMGVVGKSFEPPLALFLAAGAAKIAYPEKAIVELEEDSEFIFEMAKCLAHANEVATKVFVPMFEAMTTFSTKEFLTWRWRKHPGAFERHLQRRQNNPLFRPERRIVRIADVYAARSMDDSYIERLSQEVAAIRSDITPELPSDWTTHLNGLRQRIDDIRQRLLSAGGDISALDASLLRMRDYVIGATRVMMSENSKALLLLDKAEHEYQQLAALWRKSAFRAHLLHPLTPIPDDEVVRALLCEDLEDVVAFVQHPDFPRSAWKDMRETARLAAIQAEAEGVAPVVYWQKLRALDV